MQTNQLAANLPGEGYGTLSTVVVPATAPASTDQRLASHPAAAQPLAASASPPPAAAARKSVCHRHPCVFIFLAACCAAAIVVGVVMAVRGNSGGGSHSDAVETAPSSFCAEAAPAHLRFVSVGSLDGLSRAASDARPGDLIQLGRSVDGGRIPGRWSTEGRSVGQGTADQPVTLCATPGVSIDGGNWQSGAPVLHLSGLSHWTVTGVTVERGLKGVMMDACAHVQLDRISVHTIGQEAVHFRSNTHHCSLRRSSVSNTGLAAAQFGEAVYIGTALSNMAAADQWDRSDFNTVELNALGPGVTADLIDIKEGSCCGRVLNNTFDGRGQSATAGVSSWVNVKGNDYWLQGNSGVNTPADGFVTFVVAPGWGQNATFVANTVDLSRDTEGNEVDAAALASRVGVRVGAASEGVTVACANTMLPPQAKLSNRACTADVQQI